MASPISKESLLEHHLRTQGYISEYIIFADAKAGVALGIAFALLVFFGNALREQVNSCLEIHLFIRMIGVGMLLLATYYFLWKVIWPRYVIDRTAIMSWSGVAAYPSAEEYGAALSELDEAEVLEKQVAQSYALAQVCKKKYDSLRLGFIWLILGATLSALVWFLRG